MGVSHAYPTASARNVDHTRPCIRMWTSSIRENVTARIAEQTHAERFSSEPWPGLGSGTCRSGSGAGAVAICVLGEGGVGTFRPPHLSDPMPAPRTRTPTTRLFEDELDTTLAVTGARRRRGTAASDGARAPADIGTAAGRRGLYGRARWDHRILAGVGGALAARVALVTSGAWCSDGPHL